MRAIRIQATDLFNLNSAIDGSNGSEGATFDDEAEAIRWIEGEQARFEDSGYNRLHGYWWAQGRNDTKRYRWWIIDTIALAA